MKKFLVVALVIVACVSSSNGLRCYSCIFPGDAKCQDAKDLQPEECSEPGTLEKTVGAKSVCMKNVIDIKGIKQITRSCTLEGLNLNPCKISTEHSEFCEVCQTDLCNGSNKMIMNIWLVIISIAAFLSTLY